MLTSYQPGKILYVNIHSAFILVVTSGSLQCVLGIATRPRLRRSVVRIPVEARDLSATKWSDWLFWFLKGKAAGS